MTARLPIIACTLLLCASLAFAEEPATLKVVEIEFCTGIEDRSPVGTGKEFPNTAGRIYCFTRIAGAAGSMTVVHVWYYDDEEKARVTLPVQSKSWRTWSSKRMLRGWTGKWRVEVQDPDGKLLRSSEFLVEAESAPEQHSPTDGHE
ncbi:MAG TPA: DUF2914 domain-containing protein [Patescibacteria group bacterium]|nr:DUF2914 domain-containing protein [Patescibacteria group bacterium]